MLGIDVGAPPLPEHEKMRVDFIARYAEDSGRRLTHTSHHRGQQMAMLRMLGRDLHSNYGPTADTGGLMQNHAPTIYAYDSVEALLTAEPAGGAKRALPGAGGKSVTERPDR